MITAGSIHVTRRPEQLVSDDKRVILRYLDLVQPARIRSVFRRAAKVPAPEVAESLRQVKRRFSRRHKDLESTLIRNFEAVAHHVRDTGHLSDGQKLLIGAHFTMEYSIEAAALFNPSIVPHPDQDGLPSGSVRILLSLRATGEGHLSCIVFRRGVIDRRGTIALDPVPRHAYSVRPVPDRWIKKNEYRRRFANHGGQDDPVSFILKVLPDPFSIPQLRTALNRLRGSPDVGIGFKRLTQTMLWMALSNYELNFPYDCLPSEMVIFPATPYEGRGMEDVRLVRFVSRSDQVWYYGTYTAFDGLHVYPMLLETMDFRNFRISTMSGRFARNKGMAIFPRKINGQYAMLSRHDGESLHLLRSKNLYVWDAAVKLQTPKESWELLQLGNCGSPIETDAGWLVITHGVGAMRQYSIGASLLDRRNPERLIGRLRRPLLVPTSREREGYVPNVVYSCGSMIHRGRLIIPYAVSDSRTSFASVSVRSLIQRLLADGP